MNDKMFWEDDRVWGVILIGLGMASVLFRPFERFDSMVKGETDEVLTAILFVMAATAIFLAIKARPSLKALAILWILLP